jgi:hypothetical protein
MKKGMFAVLCIAMFVLQSIIVFAGVSPYTDYRSLTTTSSVIRRVGTPLIAHTCNLKITTDPNSRYFLGEARRECVQNNKGDLFCQEQCIDKMKLFIYTGKIDSQLGMLGAYDCKGIGPEAIEPAKDSNQCYFMAKDACALANPTNDYCRRKCVQQSYAVCRRNIAAMRYS